MGVMSKTKFGTFEELLEITPPPLQSIVKRLREIVLEVDQNSVEVVRLGERAATYGVGPKKMSEGYVYILPYSKWVNLGFYMGAALADPDGLMEGTGAKLRHIKIRSIEECELPTIRTLIKQAFEERKETLGLQ